MSLLLLPVLSGLMELPDPSGRFQNRAIPRHLIQISMEFLVSPQGRIRSCRVIYPSVVEELGAELCRSTYAHDFGRPARGPDGEHAWGIGEVTLVRTTRSRLPSEEDSNYVAIPDLELTVSQLPGGLAHQEIRVVAFIGEDGSVLECQPESDDGQGILAGIACEHAGAHTFEVHRDFDNIPVRYVTALQVNFVAEGPAD